MTMRTTVGVVLLALAGCGGNDEYVPTDAPQAIDAPLAIDAPAGDAPAGDAAIIDGAPLDAAIDAVALDAGIAIVDEADRNFDTIEAALIAYHNANDHNPATTQPLTPGVPCCAQTGAVCPVIASQWSVSPWQDIPFAITAPHLNQYSYQANDGGLSVEIIATGDIDCDGLRSDFTLTCTTAPGGAPSCTRTAPAVLD